jgi:hypothetical protein
MSHNSEILIIQHLRRIVPRPEVLLFIRKKVKQTDLRDMFKKASKNVYTSTVVVILDAFLLLHQLCQLLRLQKTEQDVDDPEPADMNDIQVEYSSD